MVGSVVTARVIVSVEVQVRAETWNEHSSVEQVHREAEELAIKKIEEACGRSIAFKLVGSPIVDAVFTRKKVR